MFTNILLVCVGNICRSPMAEGLLKHHLAQSAQTNHLLTSAGLNALVGHKADEKACHVLIQKGIDISSHRACQLNSVMVRKADLILVMETSHKKAIEDNEPGARGKVFRLGEWGKFEIADPYQKDLSIFEDSALLIEQGINQWLTKL